MAKTGVRITADSSSYQQAMKKAVQSMKELSSEYGLAATKAKLFGSAQDQLKTKVEELQKKISQQTEIVELNKKQQAELADHLQKWKDKQAQLQREIEATKQALKESTATTGENSDETKKLQEQLAKLQTEERQAGQQVDKCEDQLSRQKIATNKSEQALVELQGELKKTNKELKNAAWDEWSKKATKAADTLESVGKKLSVVSGAIAGVGVAAVKTTADFDSEMSTVQSISGATGEEFDDLRGKALEMGSKTAFSASEAASAMEYMAMAGWTTEDMLSGIEGVMAAAAASGEDLASTSDILTDGLTAFGMAASDSAHFADVLVAAGNNANTNVAMMGETFKYAGAVCGTLGIKVEDCAIATGLMGNAGIKASQAGTALRSGLTKLINPTDAAAAAMEKYGFSVQTNQDGSVDFMATMKNLRSAMGGLDATTQAAAISTIFGTEAMSGWSAIVTASEGDFNKLTDAIYGCDGAAQKAADVKLDNLSGQITILKSTIEGIAIQIGDILMPKIRSVVEKIQEWATAFSEADEGTKKNIVTIAGVVAAIGPLLVGVGKVIKVVISTVDAFKKMKTGLTAVKGALGLLTSPIGLIVAAIAALVAAFMHLWNTNEGFRTAITDIWNEIVGTVTGFIDGIKERLAGLGIKFEDIGAAIKKVWNGLCEVLAPVFEGAFKQVSNVLKAATNTILGIIDFFVSLFKGDWDGCWTAVKDIFGTVWELVCNTFQNAINTIRRIADVILGWFGTSWNEAWNGVKTFFSNIWNAISTTVSNVWNTIKNAIQVGIMFVVELVKAAFNLITLPWRFIWENCHETLEAAWAAIKNAVNTAITAVKTAVTTAWNAIKTTTTTIWNAVSGAISTVWNGIKSAVSTAVNAVKNTVSTVWNAVKTTTTTVWNAVKTAVSTPINAAKTAVSTALNAVKSAVTSAWNAVKSVTTSTWNAIKNAISTPINTALSTVKNVISKIRSAFNFSWSLPKLKMPHLSISGRFSINPPRVPRFSISWWKTGAIMDASTIFGMNGSTLLGGGEAGQEAILPLEPFYVRLGTMLDEKLTAIGETIGQTIVYVYNYLDGDEIASRQIVKVEKHLTGSSRAIRRATT